MRLNSGNATILRAANIGSAAMRGQSAAFPATANLAVATRGQSAGSVKATAKLAVAHSNGKVMDMNAQEIGTAPATAMGDAMVSAVVATLEKKARKPRKAKADAADGHDHKADAMEKAATTAPAVIQPGKVNLAPVITYNDEQTAAFTAADAAATLAANGAPLAFIASLLIADNLAGGVILEARGKAMPRVDRMTHAKNAFGSERTAFRYFSLALSYKEKGADDVQTAVSLSSKDDGGAAIESAFHRVQRATGLLLGMMSGRGYYTMHNLAVGLGHEKAPAKKAAPKKADAADTGKDGEGESLAAGGKVDLSKADAAVRMDVILAALKPGGFSDAQRAVIAEAFLACQSADAVPVADAPPADMAAAG